MSKFVFFLAIILIGLFYVLHFDKVLTDQFASINSLKKEYVIQSSALSQNINAFFNQASKIKELSKENQELLTYKNLYTSTQAELQNIKNSTTLLKNSDESLQLVKVLSYVNFNDFTKVWLDTEKLDAKIQGLVDGEFSAGIVIQKANKSQALLNGHEKSNYSVFIGKNRAPGIIHKNRHKDLLSIKYIPIWIDIEIGDEVITSGMDNIFFEGLKVGKVVKINKMQDQQEAFIKPYSKILQKKYFHIYDKRILQEPNQNTVEKEEILINKKP